MGSPIRHLPTNTRFWAQVQKTDDCWLWTGSRTQSGRGYGQFEDNGVRYQAHRYSYSLENGDIAPGLEACHRCDNPACVNPAHIFLGTHRDNMRDMAGKGRHKGALGKTKSHCKRGHAYEEGHAGIRKNGTRYCRTCEITRLKQYRREQG